MSNDKLMTIDELKDFSADVDIEYATTSVLEISRDDWGTTIAVLKRLARGHAYAKSKVLNDDNISFNDQRFVTELSDRIRDLKMVMMEAFGGPGGAAYELDEMMTRTNEFDIDAVAPRAVGDLDRSQWRGEFMLSRMQIIAESLIDIDSVYTGPDVVTQISEDVGNIGCERVIDIFMDMAENACGGAAGACQRIMHRHRNVFPESIVEINGVLLWVHHALILGFIEELEIDAEEMIEAQRSLMARGLMIRDPEDGELRLTPHGLEEVVDLFGIEKSDVPDLYKAMTPKPKGNVKPIR